MLNILFVCVQNSGRSQMAEAMLNERAAGRARAVSAGTEPAKAVAPIVVKVMREVGLDISHQKPTRLTTEMIKQADKIITMGCGVEGVCPAPLVETEDWALNDPGEKPLEIVRKIREQIKAKVLELLEKIT